MGCDLDWGTKRPAGAAGGGGGAADLLPSGHGNDDGDDCFPRGNPLGNNVSSGETKVLGDSSPGVSALCYINALISHFTLWQVFLVLGPGQGPLSFYGKVL